MPNGKLHKKNQIHHSPSPAFGGDKPKAQTRVVRLDVLQRLIEAVEPKEAKRILLDLSME